MIGSDGIVLSADQSRVLPADAEGNFDDQMLGPKIYHIGRHGIAYAVAGDDLTDEIGYHWRASPARKASKVLWPTITRIGHGVTRRYWTTWAR